MKDWQKIKHLYLRAGFGLSPKELETKQKSSLSKEIKAILKIKNTAFRTAFPSEFTALQTRMKAVRTNDRAKFRELKVKARNLTPKVNLDWVNKMASTSDPLLEKMTLFWHGHFACHSELPHMASEQINTIRKHALGNFRDLVKAISKDPSMIIYLNGQQNTVKKSNENFARELMELFTIGIGHYTEDDVKEAGRAFTGWTTDRIEASSEFKKKRHDSSTKQFMGQSGNFQGDDIVDIILENKETARFIARKVYRYFVNHKVDENHIDLIANRFFDSDYNISRMMEFIFKSDWFYDKKNMGSKIKSPIELIVGMIKTLDAVFVNPKLMMGLQRNLGQRLFFPPNVAGWPGDKAWIDNSTLLIRLNLPVFFLAANNSRVKGVSKSKMNRKKVAIQKEVDLTYFTQKYANATEAEIATTLVEHLIQAPLSVNKELLYLKLRKGNKDEKILQILSRTMSLPEYQLC